MSSSGPLSARGRRIWRRAAARSVAVYAAERRLAGEHIDATRIRDMLMDRARRAGIDIIDVDAVMRAADLRDVVPPHYAAAECEP